MEKNQTLELKCDALGTNGEGIVRLDDGTVFVPYFLPGERADVKILKVKGKIAYGKIVQLHTPAEERVKPACEAFYRCGGCQLQHMNYRSQLAFKRGLVRDTLKKIGGIDVPVSPCEGSESEWAYRNKLQLPIGRSQGKNVIGFYAERSHVVIPIGKCPIHPDWAEKLIAALYEYMETCGLEGYDEVAHTGQLRHIVVRELKGRFIVTLVVAERVGGREVLLGLLDRIFGEYTFYFNYNRRDTNVVFGDEFELVKGKGSYECTDGGISFEAGANTFVQVNESVRRKLYRKAVSLAVESEDDVVIDCYAGGGMMTAMFAKKCRHAYGIEIVPEASRCADGLKRKNGLEGRMTNICGKVEERLPAILEREESATVVLDPPRAGVQPSVLHALMSGGIGTIVMISCNPATLARDLGILTGSLVENEAGELVKSPAPKGPYQILFVQPYDMFAQTKWVEVLVKLSRI